MILNEDNCIVVSNDGSPRPKLPLEGFGAMLRIAEGLLFADFRLPLMTRRWKPPLRFPSELASIYMRFYRGVPALLSASLVGWLGLPTLPVPRSQLASL